MSDPISSIFKSLGTIVRFGKRAKRILPDGTAIYSVPVTDSADNPVQFLVKGAGTTIQTRGLLPQTSLYAGNGDTAETVPWEPEKNKGYGLPLTCQEDSDLATTINTWEEALQALCVMDKVLPLPSKKGLLKSRMQTYQRVKTFMAPLRSDTVVQNTEHDLSPKPLFQWEFNPLLSHYSLEYLYVCPVSLTYTKMPSGQEFLSVRFAVDALRAGRKRTPQERFDSMVENPEGSYGKRVVGALKFFEKLDEDDRIAESDEGEAIEDDDDGLSDFESTSRKLHAPQPPTLIGRDKERNHSVISPHPSTSRSSGIVGGVSKKKMSKMSTHSIDELI